MNYRISLLFVLSFFTLNCVGTTREYITPIELNGTWIPIQQEMGGKIFPSAIFQKQSLVILDTAYTVYAESIDIGVLYFKENKIDIYGQNGVNKGKHFTAIYTLDSSKLTICYNLKGDSYPGSYETAVSPLLFKSVFVKKKAE